MIFTGNLCLADLPRSTAHSCSVFLVLCYFCVLLFQSKKWFEPRSNVGKKEKESCCLLVQNFEVLTQCVPTAVNLSFSAFTWQPFQKWIRMILGQMPCFSQLSCVFFCFSTGFFFSIHVICFPGICLFLSKSRWVGLCEFIVFVRLFIQVTIFKCTVFRKDLRLF